MTTSTATKTLNAESIAFLTAMREAVVEKGADYIYPQVPLTEVNENADPDETACLYTYKGKPSCIVGHGLLNSGLLDQISLDLNEGQAAFIVVPGVVDYAVIHGANNMQEAQDRGVSWGEAWNDGLNYIANHQDGPFDVSGFRL